MSQEYENFRAAVVGMFQAGFVQPLDPTAPPDTAPDPFFPYSLPNHKIDQPENGPWGAFTINEGRRIPLECTGLSYRTPGVLYLQVFLPENDGTRLSRQAADLMTDLFQYKTLEVPGGVVRFREVSFRSSLGSVNGFERSNVEVEFQWDQYHTA